MPKFVLGHQQKVDRGQTREICQKQENYFKGKVVTFTVQSLLLCQCLVDLLTFLKLEYLKMGKFGLADAICDSFVKAILSRCGTFKSKETCLCERNGNTFTLNSYYTYPCSGFHFTVNEISQNKTKNCLRRLTAVETKGYVQTGAHALAPSLNRAKNAHILGIFFTVVFLHDHCCAH